MHGRRFLLVLQTESEPPSTGRVGRMLRERGYELELRRPLRGDPLPHDLDGYAGAVVFGGPMSVNDDDSLPGIRAELEWIPAVLDSGKPFLGICLGAQLLARVLGAQVGPHPEGLAEIGYFPVRPTEAGAELFAAPLHVYHWHLEGFELPHGATLLAEGECFPNQAYRYGPGVYGIQFHPEVTQDMMADWMRQAADKLTLPGAQSAEDQLAGHARHDPRLGDWLERFFEHWLHDSD